MAELQPSAAHTPVPDESWDMSWIELAYSESRIGTWMGADPVSVVDVMSEPNELLHTNVLNRRIEANQRGMDEFDMRRACLPCLGRRGKLVLRDDSTRYAMCPVCNWYPVNYMHRAMGRHRPTVDWERVRPVYEAVRDGE